MILLNRLDLYKMAALIGFMPEDPGLNVASKVNLLTSMSGPGRLVMVALPLQLKDLLKPRSNSKTVKMDLAMLVMSLKNLGSIQLALDSMINTSLDLLIR